MLSRNSLLILYSMQALCTLKTLKKRRKKAERKQMLTGKAYDLPNTKLRGRAMRRGLKATFMSHIFFMNRSVQVSYSLKVFALTAFWSNCAPWMFWIDSLSLYFPMLSLSSFSGEGAASIFFLMSRMVRKMAIMRSVKNSKNMMILWEFWRTVNAIIFRYYYWSRQQQKKVGREGVTPNGREGRGFWGMIK